jgi:hypothetical protein
MQERWNNGMPNAMPIYVRTAGTMSLLSVLLAFVLSAVMAIGFMVLVNKTHDLLSAAQLSGPVVVRR